MRVLTISAVLTAGLSLSSARLFGAESTAKKSTSQSSAHNSSTKQKGASHTASTHATSSHKASGQTASNHKASGHAASSHPATASHKSASGKSKSARHNTHGKTTKQAARRPTQSAPAPERYMEIQRALADRGYYKGSVDGNWNAESVDALKRFQKDQNLTSDGKISSLALIGLGLGPKHEPMGDYASKPASTPSNP